MTVLYHFGGKVEAKKVDKVIRSEKGKDLNIIKGFKFRFQNILLRIRNDGAVLIKT
jgi:hypothetical protein